MIISRTGLRISLLGGGSDYPQFFSKYGGAALSFTIDKYCYLFVRKVPPFFEYKNVISYRKREYTQTIEEISHPAIRGILQYYNQKNGWEITHSADLPARSGMGSSSSFVVGLIHIMYYISDNGKYLDFAMDSQQLKRTLALEAIHIERDILKEAGGYQDEIISAYGGLNLITFNKYDFNVEPLIIPMNRLRNLENHLMLCYTKNRNVTSSDIVSTFVDKLKKEERIKELEKYAHEGVELIADGNMNRFGQLLHQSWEIKKGLSPETTTKEVDEIYQLALDNGAYGGKLLGAGGGGFMLLCAKPENHKHILDSLKPHEVVHVPFSVEFQGSQIIYKK